MINGYALVFGVLIVSGGRMADMFGRRRMFFLGAAIFAAFSLLGGLAPDIEVLLFARAVDGHRRGADVAGDPRHDVRDPAASEGRASRAG